MAWTERYVSVAGGGAHDGTSEANAWTLAEAIAGVGTGQRVNVIAGTYANTTTSRTFATAGTVTANIWWRGYKTTIGDQEGLFNAVAGTDIPLWTFTTGQLSVTGTSQIFSNIASTSQCTTAGGAWKTSVFGIYYNVRIENTAANAAACAFSNATTGPHLVSCWLKTNAAAPVISAATTTIIEGCRIIGGSQGVSSTSTTFAAGCVFSGQASDCILDNGQVQARWCTFYGAGGHGINITAGSTLAVIGCHFENINQASKAAIANTTGANFVARLAGNTYFNNTANLSGITENFQMLDGGTLASTGFIDGAGGDFRPSLALIAAGFPRMWENESLFQSYPANGAVQAVRTARARMRMFGA